MSETSDPLLDATGEEGPRDGATPGEGLPAVHSPEAPAAADPVGPIDPMRLARLTAVVESLLFVADGPIGRDRLAAVLDPDDGPLLPRALEDLIAARAESGVIVAEVAGGYQLRTNPRHAEPVQRFLAQRPVRLSRAQIETLAIVGYRQPITRPEIDEIRGVDSGAVLKLLLERALIRVLGKKEEPGRPMLYGTTKEFLELFNLRDLRDLPSLREFQELSEEHKAQVEALEDLAAERGVVPSEAAAATAGAESSRAE